MARTIEEIKAVIAADFMSNTGAAEIYGFTPGEKFTARFSKVSVENTLFYIVACAVWVVETLFDTHKSDVETRIEQLLPHTTRWYRGKALNFLYGYKLLTDSDEFDTAGKSEADIEAARVVKYAVSAEEGSKLVIKVAGESADGTREPISAEACNALSDYFAEIKDAGVKIELVNRPADTYGCSLTVWYNPTAYAETVEQACRAAIREYVENLPFNGRYTNADLVARVCEVTDVVTAQLTRATVEGEVIDGYHYPAAGYFAVADDKIIITMNPYDNEQV